MWDLPVLKASVCYMSQRKEDLLSLINIKASTKSHTVSNNYWMSTKVPEPYLSLYIASLHDISEHNPLCVFHTKGDWEARV